MLRTPAGAEILRGSLWSSHVVPTGMAGAGRTPIETLGRRDPSESRGREARERRPGEIRVKADDGEPWKEKTQGSSQRAVC